MRSKTKPPARSHLIALAEFLPSACFRVAAEKRLHRNVEVASRVRHHVIHMSESRVENKSAMANSSRTSNADASFLQLKQITDEILFSDSDRTTLEASIVRLYSVFSNITGLDADSERPDDTVVTMLDHGRAISPKQAAGCILDFVRTAQFLRGLHAAVLEAQRRFPDQTLDILYAGCGPFAPLAIPLTTQFTADEIQFTLLDVHQRSLDTARGIFKNLGLGHFVRDYKQCDASSYRHPAQSVLHMIVTETMQAALLNEPQVSIAMNLAPQLCSGGILIPESVAIDVCLWDLEYKPRPVSNGDGHSHPSPEGPLPEMTRIHLGRVAEVTLETCRSLSKKLEANLSEERFLPAGSVETPLDATENFYLTLLTTITVFGRFVLSEYDSLLTYPIVMHDLGKIRGGMKIEFYYQMGAKPGFKCRLVRDGETRDGSG